METAYRDGKLDLEQRAVRIGRAQEAATEADLTTLVKDLSGGSARLLARADREKMAARLAEARDDGRLDPAEHEFRLAAAGDATTVAEAAPLFADLITPPRPALRGPLDVVFDNLILNSAMLSTPRHWWQRAHPKATWKVLTLGILAAWAYPIVKFPIWIGLTMGAGWIPVVALLSASGWLSRIGAGEVEARQAAHLRDLRGALGRDHPEVTVVLGYDSGVVKVGLAATRGPGVLPAALPEEAVRLLWGSRIYPLTKIEVVNGLDATIRTVVLKRADRKRLRHQYGPRPYGRLPREDLTPWE